MIPDPKRTAQACRVYDALLRYYPIAFQREYGDTLALQFRDEYREVLASGNSLFRFWIFILFDLMRSLLSEVLEEGVKMFRKNFFVYSGILTGIASFIMGISSIFDFMHLIPGFWRISPVILSFFLLFGALTLLGITKTVQHFFFWIIAGLALVIAVYMSLLFVSLALDDGGAFASWLYSIFDNIYRLSNGLFKSADRAMMFIFYCHYIIMGVFGIGLLVKRKWALAVCMLWSLPTLALQYVDFIPDNVNSLWFLIPYWTIATAAWFVIAWMLYKENTEIPTQEVLEAA